MMSTLVVPHQSHAADRPLAFQKQDRLIESFESLTKQGGASRGELAVIYEEGVKIRNELAHNGLSTSPLDETIAPLGKVLSLSKQLEQCRLDHISKELTAQAVSQFSFEPCKLPDNTTKTVVQLSDSLKDIEKTFPGSSVSQLPLRGIRNLIAQKTKKDVLKAYFKMTSHYLEYISPEQNLDIYVKNKM